MVKLNLNPGDEVVLAPDTHILETGNGPLELTLWVVKTLMGWRVMLDSHLGLQVVNLQKAFVEGDLARVYTWLQETEPTLAICYGLNISSKNAKNIGIVLTTYFGEMVKAKAGELGQRPGIPAGMPVAEPVLVEA